MHGVQWPAVPPPVKTIAAILHNMRKFNKCIQRISAELSKPKDLLVKKFFKLKSKGGRVIRGIRVRTAFCERVEKNGRTERHSLRQGVAPRRK